MYRNVISCVALACGLLLVTTALAPSACAQTITSGDITGTVTDPSGAILANAKVTVKNEGTGAVQNTATGSSGTYRFAFLPPGRYTVDVQAPGFTEMQKVVSVQVGQVATVDVQMSVATATQTVEVSEAGTAVQTENGDITTTFNTTQVQELPNGGNDVTYIAQTAPGVVQNTGGGYGNFSTFGLPGTANLFTTNGQNNMDPYFNLNNSGATNLSLGRNEVAEVSVINNGYSGQYGQLAGSQVDVVTKSGTNQFHGNGIWMWAGSALAANDFFANASDTPKTHFNDNQWADSIGGPIWKNKTFFFFNNEGIRIVLPAAPTLVKIPSPEFQAATLTNLNATGQSAEIPFYQQAFNLYNKPSGLSGTAIPVPGGGCGSFTGLGAGVPCADQFRQSSNTFTHERIWSLRIDQQLGKNDKLYGRYYDDNGMQATGTDPINPVFNAFSPQPAYQGQLSETHTFGATAVNQFLFSGFYYSAIFGPTDYGAAKAAFPTQLSFTGGLFTTLAPIGNYPQGRVVYQWQFVDDFSKVWGNHSIKTGFNYHRNPFTDYGNEANNVGTLTLGNLTDFYNGVASARTNLVQVFPTVPTNDFVYNQFGAYIQDEWRVTANLKLNLAIRADHNGNLSCNTNCFSLLQPFNALSHSVTTPYNQSIVTNQQNPLPSVDTLVWEPRMGFAWSPSFAKNTVIRGGAGIFSDSIPLTFLVPISQNAPNLFSARATGPNVPIAPGISNGLYAAASAANQAFQNGFKNSATLAQLSAAVPNFSTPRLSTADNPLHTPRYYEWNLEVQQQLPWATVLSVNYVGNHGSKELIRNAGVNAYCDITNCGGFAGLPTAAPDPRFGRVVEYQNSAFSNYDGVTISANRRMSGGLLFGLNYSYSHALDVVSNGGRLPFVYNTNLSETWASNPYNVVGSMYGNADYDVRHNITANFVWDNAFRRMFKWGPNILFSGWTVSGDVFHRTGLPFTVIDTGTTSGIFNYSGDLFAQVSGSPNRVCGASAVDVPCLGSQFTSPTGFSNQARNQFFGPNFTNVNLNIVKDFPIKERVMFRIGASFYNLFNHPNFDQPVNDIANPQLGQIISTVGPPTSIFGAFVGSQSAPRDIQFRTEIRF